MNGNGCLTIVLLGVPRAQRMRSTKGGRHYHTADARAERAALRLKAEQVVNEEGLIEPIRGAVEFHMLIEKPIPDSWSKKRKNLALTGEILPTVIPDFDNYAKLASDALKGVVWLDDKQVTDAHIKKRYSLQPKLVLTIRQIATL
jgi:Holliday junction resolvase RusA-like endonuclease